MNELAFNAIRLAGGAAAGAADVRRQQETTSAAQAEAAIKSTAPAATKREVETAAAQLESYLKASNRELHFQVDDESGEVIVRVRDASSGEVIRQIPSEEALRMARALQDKSPALLDLVV